MESVWKNTNESLPVNTDEVIVVGAFGTLSMTDGPGSSGAIITIGSWNEREGRWTVNEPALAQQMIHNYGSVRYWTEMLPEFNEL